jgi:Cd2+/Zn2+-exporting ATPase
VSASVARLAGVTAADINFASGTLLVEYDPVSDPRAAVVSTVERSGHGIVPLDEASAAETGPSELPWYQRYRTEIAVYGSGVFALLGWLLQLANAPAASADAAFALAILFGGALVWRRALVALRAHMIDMNVLMTIAVLGAAAIGDWGEAAAVTFLFAVGGYLEARALERTRRSIRDLMSLAPETARVRREGAVVEVLSAEVAVGQTVLVRPGERIPLDGVISVGSSALDEAAITGESVPVDKTVGDEVFAGSLNSAGALEIVTTALANESTLARVVYLVEEAQATKAPVQRLVDRFSRWYTPAVVALAVLIAVVPPALGVLLGADWGGFSEWFQRALVVLVVSCPCALVISTPVSIVSAITRAGRDGVLVKGGAYLEIAAGVSVIAFDKTGTLTVGRPEVAEVLPLDGYTRAEVLNVAAALESHSAHPLAQAIVRAEGGGVEPGRAHRVSEEPGRGVRGTVEGLPAAAGTPAFVEDALSVPDSEMLVASGGQEVAGLTSVVVVLGGQVIGLIGIADEVRAEARSVVSALRRQGIGQVLMLTGDNERTGRAIAEQAGIAEVRARLLPDQKTAAIDEIRSGNGALVAMVGDGVNDAPALALSDVGIAMGAAGSDTALETADVALMADDLTALPGFFALARRTVRIIRQNVAFSVAVKLVVLVLAVIGTASLWMAVFADTGVALLVILNGMRLLSPNPPRPLRGAEALWPPTRS